MPNRGFRGPPWRQTHSPPPWWPEGEPWPPQGPPWRRAGRGFQWRILIPVGLLLLLVAVAVAFAFNSGRHEWSNDRDGPPFPWFFIPLFWIGFVIFSIWTFRRLRRTLRPIAEVMEAAGRVAEGDYSVRVRTDAPSDVRQLVEAFNTMTIRLQTNEEQRKHLFADTAHELRTPLAVIQGTIEGMLDGVYPKDETHLAPLLDQTRIIARLLNDLQTIATAEAGVLVLHRSETDLGSLIQDTVASFAPGAGRNGIELRADVEPLPEIPIDPVRIRQVLDNLVSNALRYTPAGGSVRIEAIRDDGAVRVSVQDSGRGMTPEEITRVFERFVKSLDSGGSGLGLAIARSLVEAHGGTIVAESAPGRGTTITFTLPLGTPG